MFQRRRHASVHLGLMASLVLLTLAAAVPAPRVLAAPSVSVTLGATNTSTNGDTKAEPGDTITYTATITNNGVVSPTDDATGVGFTDTPDGNTTLVSGSVESTPIARPDFYNALGNVPITIQDASGILGNDGDPDGDGVTLVSVQSTSAMGGTISNTDSSGGFTYDPPAGFHGTDSFTYQINDGNASRVDTGTVFVTVTNMIWFINSAATSTGAVGTYNHPFNSITAFNTINDGTFNTGTKTFHPGTGDTIFICTGGDASGPCTGSPGNYSGNLTMLNSQYLIGQGAGSSITAITGLSSPANSPSLPNTGKSRPTLTGNITVQDGNRIDGMNLSPSSGTALTGNGSASSAPYKNFTIAETPINNSGGQAINLNHYNLSATFTSVSSAGGTYGIQVQNTTGSFTVNGNQTNNSQGSDGSGGTIQTSTTDGASFTNATNISLRDMTFTNANTTNNLACTDDHSVTAAANQNCNGALYLVNDTPVSLNHLEVNGTTQAGIVAYGVNGFTLNNSEVQNIGPKTTAGTGDFDSGVFLMELSGSSNSITNSNIHDVSAADIEARNFSATLTSLSVSNDTLGHTGTNPPNQAGDPGSGAIKFQNDGAVMNIDVEGTSMLNIDNTPFFSNSQGSGHTGIILGKTGTVTQQKINPTNGVGAGIDITAAVSAQVKIDIENYTIWGTASAGINTNTDATSNNTGASVGGTIAHNAIGCSSTDASGSFDACGVVGQVTAANTAGNAGGNGINIRHNKTGVAVFDIHGNHIFGLPAIANAFGMEIYTGDESHSGGAPELDALINGNTVNINAHATGASDMFLQGGNSGGDNAVACFDVGRSSANSLSNSAGYGAGGHDIKLLSDHVIDVPGASGTATTTIASFVSGNNNAAGVTASTGGSPAGTYSNPANCPNTTVPAPPTSAVSKSPDLHGIGTAAAVTGNQVAALVRSGTAKPAEAAGQAHAFSTRRFVSADANFGAGNTLSIGTLPAGHTVTITFQATVNANINNPTGATKATNGIQVTGSNFSTQTASADTSLNLLNSQVSVTGPATTPLAFQSTTFTAHVTFLTGSGSPSGSVTFWDGAANTGTNLGTGTIDTGTHDASISTSALAGGNHTITAVYGGDTRFNSSSNTLSQAVNGLPTTTGVISSKNPANVNDNVTFTATVSQSTDSTSTPTGAVLFKSDGTAISSCGSSGSVTVSAVPGHANQASAQCSISSLAAGTHSITVFYTPADSSFVSSDNTGSPLSQEIDQLPTVTLDASTDSGTVGDNITNFTKPKFDGTATKGVNITVLDGATTYCTTSSDATTGAWSCTGGTALTSGVHSITASAANPGGTAVSTPALSVTIDTAIPTIKTTGYTLGPPASATLGVQDVLSGLSNITVKKCTNCTYTVNGTKNPGNTFPDPYSFTGQTSQIPVVFTRVNNAQSATLTLSATDVAGNINDPDALLLGRGTGTQVAAVLNNIDSQETQIDVLNSTVGITKLILTVNGHVLQFPNLVNGQKFSFNIAPLLKAGHNNTIAVVAIGPKDSSALIFVAPPHN
jgi:uncharacterized repeat protein (TIGR01451 family)